MKLVLLPGVGLTEDTEKYERFLKKLETSLKGWETEFFIWEHIYKLPPIDSPFSDLRKFMSEVILDFQQVVKYPFDTFVPDADLYIGHSAGSILALAQSDKPCITMGSPSALVEYINQDVVKETSDVIFSKNRSVLNIVNKYDVIAFRIEKNNVENYIYSGKWFNPMIYFPVSAHMHYFESPKVLEKVTSFIERI